RHRIDEAVYVGLVDGSSAEREARYEAVNRTLVLAEDEAGKRPGPVLDRRDRVAEVGVAEDRQNRTENFVLHDLVRPVDWIENRGIEITLLLVVVAARDYLFRINERSQPPHFPSVDDPRIVGILLWPVTVEFDNLFFALSHELVRHQFVNVRVAR